MKDKVYKKEQIKKDKPKRKAPFGIRLSDSTMVKLECKADRKGQTVHAYCKDVLTKHAERK